MSRYKKEHDKLTWLLLSLPADVSIKERQAIEGQLRLLETNELRRQATKVGLDLDTAPVGPWDSHPDNPQLTWLGKLRQQEAIKLIQSTRSARRKERRDLVIKLAPIVIALLALILTVYFRVVDKKPSVAPTRQPSSATH